jgi:hypothetical protein
VAGRSSSNRRLRLLYTLLADLAVVLHFLFIVFVFAGGLLVLRRPRLAWIHLPAAAWGTLVEVEGWVCPLTPLENRFRELTGGVPYRGDFVERYLLRVIYPESLTPRVQLLLAAAVVGVNAILYSILLRRRRRAAVPGKAMR